MITSLALLAAVSNPIDLVDRTVRSLMAEQRIPGVALLITQRDRVVKSGAYGVADVELGVPMKPNMLFESGSIGKRFTATVILQLWEQGKIDLDDPVSKYVDRAPAAWKEIRIRHLLAHMSGLKDYALVKGVGLADTWTLTQWFDAITPLGLDFPTGSAWAYSNTNFLLLGLIAEKITGKPIVDLVQERIFNPLGMTQSFVSDYDRILPNRAKGYWESDGLRINGIRIGHGYGDGGWINSCEDLAKFERGLREGKLLKPATLDLAQTAGRLPTGRKTPYGFGCFVRTVNGRLYLSHGGNTGGFGCSVFRVPEKELTIVVMTNLASVGGDSVAQQIAEAYDPTLAPKPLVESPDPDPQFSATLQSALVELANANPTLDVFDPEMKTRLATGRGKMAMQAFAALRSIDRMSYCRSEPSDPDTSLVYRVKAGAKTYIVTCVVTKERKLFQAGIRLDTEAARKR